MFGHHYYSSGLMQALDVYNIVGKAPHFFYHTLYMCPHHVSAQMFSAQVTDWGIRISSRDHKHAGLTIQHPGLPIFIEKIEIIEQDNFDKIFDINIVLKETYRNKPMRIVAFSHAEQAFALFPTHATSDTHALSAND